MRRMLWTTSLVAVAWVGWAEAPVVGHVQSGESFSTLGLSVDGAWALLVGTEVEGSAWASAAFLRLE